MKKISRNVLGNIDSAIFYPLLILFIIIVLIGIVDDDLFKSIFNPLTLFSIFQFKWIAELISFSILIFLLFIAFSKYGDIKLGKEEDQPEFSTFSWGSMCFTASAGFGALLWFASEGIVHLHESTFVENAGMLGQAQGIPLALASGFMNWGAVGWSIYAFFGLAIAIPAFRLNRPLTFAGGLYGIMGEKAYTSKIAKGVDFFGAIGAAGGPAAGLGVGLMLLTSGIANLTGYTLGLAGQIGLVIFLCSAYTLSAYVGIAKGMQRISGWCIYCVAFLTIFIFLTGPTTFIANNITEAFGQYLTNFINFNFFTDAGTFATQADGTSLPNPRSWQSWWYVFYIIWFFAHAAFTGGFFARISRGRTIRQYLLGAIIFPSVFVILIMGVLSSAACYVQVTGAADLYTAFTNDTGSALYGILYHYPLSKLCMVIVVLCCAIFGITTFDAATYFVAVQTSGGDINPHPGMKLLWGILLGSVALIFLTIGNFNGLKGLGILAGLPTMFLTIFYIISVYRLCKKIVANDF